MKSLTKTAFSYFIPQVHGLQGLYFTHFSLKFSGVKIDYKNTGKQITSVDEENKIVLVPSVSQKFFKE